MGGKKEAHKKEVSHSPVSLSSVANHGFGRGWEGQSHRMVA